MFNIRNKKIWVAGHTGMVGRAVCAELAKEEVTPIVVSSQELDLRRQSDVEAWIKSEQPDAIIMCAARVGGILANDTNPAEFLYENLIMEANVIHAAHMQEVAKLVFLGSSCIYPKYAQQPIKEEYLLTGALEPTNEWYALAKIVE